MASGRSRWGWATLLVATSLIAAWLCVHIVRPAGVTFGGSGGLGAVSSGVSERLVAIAFAIPALLVNFALARRAQASGRPAVTHICVAARPQLRSMRDALPASPLY